MDNWVDRFKSAKAIDPDQPVIIPGVPELAAELDRTKNGIPLVNAVIEDLNLLADKFGLDPL